MTRRLVSLAGACAVLALPAAAQAHTGIERMSPGSGAVISDAGLVRVTFKGRISDATLVVKRSGTKVSRGDGTLADRSRQVRTRLTSSRSGRYSATVRWLSRDGHVSSRTWSFRIR